MARAGQAGAPAEARDLVVVMEAWWAVWPAEEVLPLPGELAQPLAAVS